MVFGKGRQAGSLSRYFEILEKSLERAMGC